MVAERILEAAMGGGMCWGVLVCALVGASGVLRFASEALSLVYRYVEKCPEGCGWGSEDMLYD